MGGARRFTPADGDAADRRDESVTGVYDVVPGPGTLLSLAPSALLRKLRARGWSTRRSVVLACDTAQPAGEPPGAPALEISVVDPRTFPALTDILPGACGEDALSLAAMERTRAAAAGDLVVARCGGEVAGVHFIHTMAHQQRLELVAPRLYGPLGPDEALAEGVFVFPAYRGRGVGSGMLRASLEELARQGYRRGLAIVDVENRASLRAFHAAGFAPEPTMRVDTLRLGRRVSAFRPTDPETWRRCADATTGSPHTGD
jgi:GNAT superfamily N-acetyltransferase